MRKDFVQKLKKLPNPFSRIIQAPRQLCLWAGILLLSCGMVWGQVRTPARWQFSVVEDKGVMGETVTLEFKVTLDNTWYIYSTDQDPEVGPLPAEIVFEPHESYVLLGEAMPVKVKQKYDEVWLDSIRIIAESGGGFLQKVKILSPNPVIRGSITYSVCSMETGLCIFPEEDFEFSGIKVRSAGTAPIGEDPNRGGDQAPQVVPPVGDDANSSQPDETLRQGSGAGNPGGQAGFQIEEEHSGGLGGLVRVSTNQGDEIETFPAKKRSGVQAVVLPKKPKKYEPVPSQTHVEKEILSLKDSDQSMEAQTKDTENKPSLSSGKPAQVEEEKEEVKNSLLPFMILTFCFRSISYDPLDREEGIMPAPDLDSLGKAKVESIEKQKDNNDENEDSCDINFTLKEACYTGMQSGCRRQPGGFSKLKKGRRST